MTGELDWQLGLAPDIRMALYGFGAEFGGEPATLWRVPGTVTLLACGPLRLTVATPWGAIGAARRGEDGLLELARMEQPGQRERVRAADAAAGSGPDWAVNGLAGTVDGRAGTVDGRAGTGWPAADDKRAGARLLTRSELPDGTGAGAGRAIEKAIRLCLADPALDGRAGQAGRVHRIGQAGQAGQAGQERGQELEAARRLETQHNLGTERGFRSGHGSEAEHGLQSEHGLQGEYGLQAEHRPEAEHGLENGLEAEHLSGHAVLGPRQVPCDLAAAGLRFMLVDTRVRRAVRQTAPESFAVKTAAAAIAAGDFTVLGTLLNVAHEQQPGDDEQRTAVAAGLRAGALGARAVADGAGRPACLLIPADCIPEARAEVSGEFRRAGYRPPRFLTFTPAPGPDQPAALNG